MFKKLLCLIWTEKSERDNNIPLPPSRWGHSLQIILSYKRIPKKTAKISNSAKSWRCEKLKNRDSVWRIPTNPLMSCLVYRNIHLFLCLWPVVLLCYSWGSSTTFWYGLLEGLSSKNDIGGYFIEKSVLIEWIVFSK